MSLRKFLKLAFMSLLLPVIPMLSYAAEGELARAEPTPFSIEEKKSELPPEYNEGYGGFLKFFPNRRALGQTTHDVCGMLVEQVINVAAFRDQSLNQEQLQQRLDLIGLSNVFINLQTAKKKDSPASTMSNEKISLPDRINVTSFDPNRSYFLRRLKNKYIVESGFVSGTFDQITGPMDSSMQGCFQASAPQPEERVSDRMDSNKKETPIAPSTETPPTATPTAQVATGS